MDDFELARLERSVNGLNRSARALPLCLLPPAVLLLFLLVVLFK